MPTTFSRTDRFVDRHIGPNDIEIENMLRYLGESSLDSFIDHVIPQSLRSTTPLQTGQSRSEYDTLADLQLIASKNKV